MAGISQWATAEMPTFVAIVGFGRAAGRLLGRGPDETDPAQAIFQGGREADQGGLRLT